jgi:hypothetical protein
MQQGSISSSPQFLEPITWSETGSAQA